MRIPTIAGNWKMNKNQEETALLLSELSAKLPDTEAEIIVAPTFINLAFSVNHLQNSIIQVAAQNMHYEKSGAYTGEISADMLINIGVDIVILGHSERRAYFAEDDAILIKKINTALSKNMRIIFCFGEELEDRKTGNQFQVVRSQLENTVLHLSSDQWKNVILAYEPVWAIGTGETASPEQAQEMHGFIRKIIKETHNKQIADNVAILYGGSVKPNNAKEIFSKPDVDGGLIGGASLQCDDFLAIVKAIS